MTPDIYNRELSFSEKCFSLTNHFPNKKRLCFLGLSFYWERTVKLGPVVNNRVVFWTSSDTFNCNPKYIAQKLKELNPNVEIFWIVSKKVEKSQFPSWIRLIEERKKAVEVLGTAKVIVVNERMIKWIKYGFQKQPGQFIVQTWHGSLGIKKTGDDRTDTSQLVKNRNKFDSEQIDYICSNGVYCTDLYSRIFSSCGRIFETGLPRNDIFFHQDKHDIRKSLNISEATKILLYAPTCRENREADDFCNVNFNLVTKALSERFGGEWVILYRKHYLSKLSLKHLESVYDVSGFPDIQELLNISDVVMTDYSSCIYDFVLTKRPGFIYAEDREEYENGRGLYYPLNDTPFPVASNEEELINNIKSFDSTHYHQNVKIFLKNKGVREDGSASEKMAELINCCIAGKPCEAEKMIADLFA